MSTVTQPSVGLDCCKLRQPSPDLLYHWPSRIEWDRLVIKNVTALQVFWWETQREDIWDTAGASGDHDQSAPRTEGVVVGTRKDFMEELHSQGRDFRKLIQLFADWWVLMFSSLSRLDQKKPGSTCNIRNLITILMLVWSSKNI